MNVDIPTAVSEEEIARLRELATGRDVLELGSWLGHSTIQMAEVARVLHSLDWHRGDDHAGHAETLAPFVENLKRYGVDEKVIMHVGLSDVILPLFRPGAFDFAFIDGFHTQEQCAKDAEAVARVLAPGSYLAFHDYGIKPAVDIPFGVTEAVDAFVADGKAEMVGVVRTLAVVRLA